MLLLVRRDDPSAYLRVMASVVRPTSEPELEDPFAQMTVEELKAELLAGVCQPVPRASSRSCAGTGIDRRDERRVTRRNVDKFSVVAGDACPPKPVRIQRNKNCFLEPPHKYTHLPLVKPRRHSAPKAASNIGP